MSGKLFFRVFPGKRGRQSVHVISPLRKISVWMSIHYRTWKNCFSDHCLRWTSDRLQEPHRPVQPGPRSEYSRGPWSWGCSRNGEHWAVSEGWVCKLIGSLLWSQLWFGKLIYWAGLRKPDGDVYVNGFPLCWRRQEGNLEIQKLKDSRERLRHFLTFPNLKLNKHLTLWTLTRDRFASKNRSEATTLWVSALDRML